MEQFRFYDISMVFKIISFIEKECRKWQKNLKQTM